MSGDVYGGIPITDMDKLLADQVRKSITTAKQYKRDIRVCRAKDGTYFCLWADDPHSIPTAAFLYKDGTAKLIRPKT